MLQLIRVFYVLNACFYIVFLQKHLAMIEIDNRSVQESIRRVQREYANVSGLNLKQAISRALNRTASQSRTEANKNIRQTYRISASQINSSLVVRNSSRTNLTAKIIASGKPISLTSFGAKQESATTTVKFDRKGNLSRVTRKTRKRNPASGVSFEIKKGNVERLPTAFIQTANGGTTVFARGEYNSPGQGFSFGKARLPIAKMTTISLPLMFANNDVINPTQSKALDVFNQRITHEITWLMSR